MTPNTVFLLGPSNDNVIEPVAGATATPASTATPGYRQIEFDDTPTSQGGIVNLVLQDAVNDGDLMPSTVHAVYVQPVGSVPAAASRTPEWFFQNGTANGATNPANAGDDGTFSIKVHGVKPSAQPYFVQTILEYNVPAGTPPPTTTGTTTPSGTAPSTTVTAPASTTATTGTAATATVVPAPPTTGSGS